MANTEGGSCRMCQIFGSLTFAGMVAGAVWAAAKVIGVARGARGAT